MKNMLFTVCIVLCPIASIAPMANGQTDLGPIDADSVLPWMMPLSMPVGGYARNMAAVGDVNADGIPDFAVSVVGMNPGVNGGMVLVYSGKTTFGRGLLSHSTNTLLHVYSAPIDSGDQFGVLSFSFALDGAGDVNNDGHDDVIIGLPEVNNGSSAQAGRVVVLSGIDGSVLSEIIATSNGSRLGYAVAGMGDLNGDGYADVAYSQPYDLFQQFESGKVYVHFGSATGLQASPFFTFDAADFGATDSGWFFGSSIAVTGDLDQDGYEDFLIGAETYPFSFSNSFVNGKVFVISSATEQEIPAFAGASSIVGGVGAGLGHKILGGVDFNQDGTDDIIVSGKTDVAIKMISGNDGTTLLSIPSEAGVTDLFGQSLGHVGDFDGDCIDDLFIGAPGVNVNTASGPITNAGRAYIVSGADGSTLLTVSGETTSGNLGNSIAWLGETTNQANQAFVVGAPMVSHGGPYTGEAYVYQRNRIPGDLNEDGCVDGIDLGILNAAIDETCQPWPVGCPVSDINCDGIVDAADLAILILHLGEGC